MNNYEYINNYTGEVYKNLLHAFKTIIRDMQFYKNCRTIKMFNIIRLPH